MVFISYTLSREYRVAENRCSRLLFTIDAFASICAWKKTQIDEYDVIVPVRRIRLTCQTQLCWRHNNGSEHIVLGENVGMSNRWLFWRVCSIIRAERSVKNEIMYGLPWIQNSVTLEAIWQCVARVTKSRVKIIADSPHLWQKISTHGNPYIILYVLHNVNIYPCPKLHTCLSNLRTQMWPRSSASLKTRYLQ